MVRFMNKINDALIKLLSASTDCHASQIVELDAEEWEKLYKEAIEHQIHLLIFSEANKYGSKVNPTLFDNWRKNTIFHVLQLNQRFAVVGSLLDELKDANVPILVLKGLHYKYLYREPDLRIMGDIDLLTDQQSLDVAIKVIESFGYIRRTDKIDPKHVEFFHKEYIYIELHFALFTEVKRKIALSFNSEIWNSAYYFKAGDMSFLVPSHVNQMLYCCIHMTNHFGKGGFGLRQLSDFNLLVRQVEDENELALLLEQAHRYGIGRFVEVMLYICGKLFGLRVPDAIISMHSGDKEYIDRMIDAILDSGAFGGKDRKITSNRSLATYIYQGGENVKISGLRYIFPPRASLSGTYSYAQRYAILLPVAWVHRLLNNIARRDLGFGDKIPDSKAVNEYVKLFQWLNIKR